MKSSTLICVDAGGVAGGVVSGIRVDGCEAPELVAGCLLTFGLGAVPEPDANKL